MDIPVNTIGDLYTISSAPPSFRMPQFSFAMVQTVLPDAFTIAVLAAVESLTGWNPVPNMTPIEEAMGVVASIGVVMLGSLPAAELLRRALERPLGRLGGRLGLKPESLTGMLVSLATPLPTLSMYHQLDRRGKVAAAAFLVSGASLLSAHMGFVVGTQPDMLPPLTAGKLSGALTAAVLALWTQRRDQTAAGTR